MIGKILRYAREASQQVLQDAANDDMQSSPRPQAIDEAVFDEPPEFGRVYEETEVTADATLIWPFGADAIKALPEFRQ